MLSVCRIPSPLTRSIIVILLIGVGLVVPFNEAQAEVTLPDAPSVGFPAEIHPIAVSKGNFLCHQLVVCDLDRHATGGA